MSKPLFFKHKPPKEWRKLDFVLQIVLKKDGKTFDLDDKDTAEWVYQNTHTQFYDFMQNIANVLGCPDIGNSGKMSWKNYLHPIKHIRWRLSGIWYL